MIHSLKLIIYVDQDNRAKEKSVIISKAQHYLDEVKCLTDNLYLCSLDSYQFELNFEKDYEDCITLRLKPKVPFKYKKYELMGERFDLAFYVNISLKLTEGYQIVSLNSMAFDSDLINE